MSPRPDDALPDPAFPDRTLRNLASDLRRGRLRASELAERAIAAQRGADEASSGAYKLFDADGARRMAARADERLASEAEPPPLCGIPVSVKDLYGVPGLPTFAGTLRALPPRWTEEGWLVSRLRNQGAVLTGKTHTVELAYGGVGTNPHWGTPRNPWDREEHRVPGGSSAGAGVSLLEGSALVALGTDTGGSIRIPASMTGTVGPRWSTGRWPATGVVPLSPTMDTVGVLTRSVEDAVWVFGALDAAQGDPERLRTELLKGSRSFTVGIPSGRLRSSCQDDVAGVVEEALEELEAAGWRVREIEGTLLDEAADRYLGGSVVSAECRAFLERELPGWLDLLDPTVSERIRGAPPLDSDAYRSSVAERERMTARGPALFEEVDLLALPGVLITPPRLADLDDLDAYLDANATILRSTCPASWLGLCAITLPVGLDGTGMPVGLQLLAPGGEDEGILAAALAAERVLGRSRTRLGRPPPPP